MVALLTKAESRKEKRNITTPAAIEYPYRPASFWLYIKLKPTSSIPFATMDFTKRKAIFMVEIIKKVRVVRILVQIRGIVTWKN